VKSCLAAIRETGGVKALAHITGGGFPDNIPRVLPEGFGAELDLNQVQVLPVFKWLAAAGGVSEPEMLRTFNCGIGMVVGVAPDQVDAVTRVLTREGESVARLGQVTTAGAERVTYAGRLNLG
jgi:phosphoribosylformylglycinamidine cyclo-ligase